MERIKFNNITLDWIYKILKLLSNVLGEICRRWKISLDWIFSDNISNFQYTWNFSMNRMKAG